MWRNPPADKARVVESLPPGWARELQDPALAREFKQAPEGPWSERLERLVTVMRALPVGGKPIFVVDDDGARWLARIPRRAGAKLELIQGPIEGPLTREHLCVTFSLRWEALFGEEVDW